jgi:hypothetical protein
VRGIWWRILHVFIIANLALEALYGFVMVFFVIGGGPEPLFLAETKTPIEMILRRRLYSIETWVAFAGLAIYLAITEIRPRRQ